MQAKKCVTSVAGCSAAGESCSTKRSWHNSSAGGKPVGAAWFPCQLALSWENSPQNVAWEAWRGANRHLSLVCRLFAAPPGRGGLGDARGGRVPSWLRRRAARRRLSQPASAKPQHCRLRLLTCPGFETGLAQGAGGELLSPGTLLARCPAVAPGGSWQRNRSWESWSRKHLLLQGLVAFPSSGNVDFLLFFFLLLALGGKELTAGSSSSWLMRGREHKELAPSAGWAPGSPPCPGAQVGPQHGLVPPGGRAQCQGGWRSAEEGLAWPAARPLLLLLRFEGSAALGRRDRCEHCGRLTGAELLRLPSSPSPSPSVSLREVSGLDFPSPWLHTAWGCCCCWLPAASPPPRRSSWTGSGAARKPQEPLRHPALQPPRPSWQSHHPPRGQQHSSKTWQRGTLRPPRSSTRSRTPARQHPRARRARRARSSGTGALRAPRRRRAWLGRPLPPAARHPPSSPQGRGTPMRRSRPGSPRGRGCPRRSRRPPAQVVLLSLSHQVAVSTEETEQRPRHVLRTAPAHGHAGDPRRPLGCPLLLRAPPRWAAGTQSTAAAKALVAGGWRWPVQPGAGALLRPTRGQLAAWILVLLTPPALPALIY